MRAEDISEDRVDAKRKVEERLYSIFSKYIKILCVC